MVQHAILSHHQQTCPAKVALSWCNNKLSHYTRWLFNKAKNTGEWESYKIALTNYHKKIRKAKKSTWREYCQGTENVMNTVCLMRIIASQSANNVGSIKLPNSQHTQAGTENLEGTVQSSLLKVWYRISGLAKAGAAKPWDIYCPQGGLGIIQKGHWPI